ncbi:MAG: hypothetical protein ACFBSF_17245 [Leptolyngbyaceae cyanobacterium]
MHQFANAITDARGRKLARNTFVSTFQGCFEAIAAVVLRQRLSLSIYCRFHLVLPVILGATLNAL